MCSGLRSLVGHWEGNARTCAVFNCKKNTICIVRNVNVILIIRKTSFPMGRRGLNLRYDLDCFAFELKRMIVNLIVNENLRSAPNWVFLEDLEQGILRASCTCVQSILLRSMLSLLKSKFWSLSSGLSWCFWSSSKDWSNLLTDPCSDYVIRSDQIITSVIVEIFIFIISILVTTCWLSPVLEETQGCSEAQSCPNGLFWAPFHEYTMILMITGFWW